MSARTWASFESMSAALRLFTNEINSETVIKHSPENAI